MRATRSGLGVVVLLAAGTALAQPATDYFPLKNGSKWVYAVGEKIITQAAVVTPDEAKLETRVEGKVVASETIQAKADGLYRTKVNGVGIVPPVKILELKDGKPAPKGTKWTVDSKLNEQSIRGEFTLTDTAEKVKVAAGEFEAVVVDGPAFEIAGAKCGIKYWFAPGKGVVKMVYNIAGNEATLELKEFTEGK